MGGGWEPMQQELPIPLIQVNKSGTGKTGWIRFNEEKVKKYFEAEDVKNLKISVISVAGSMRAGKSFLITFFLRYATFMYKKVAELKPGQPDDWMGNEDTRLDGGFEWRHAVDRQTSGILMWPTLFKVTLENGENVCLMIIDTQGTNDGETTSAVWAGVFAVSTHISSVQMYNIMRNIGEEELQYLEYYCGYGKIMAEIGAGQRTFQNIMFVVRDFKLGSDYEFGLDGGESYLYDRVMDMTPFAEQSQNVRKNIIGFFENLSCCVLPDPGEIVMEHAHFNGKMKDIDPRFRKIIKEFVPRILGPKNLVLKRVQGKLLTTRELFDYIKVWVDSMNDIRLPEPRSLLRATARSQHLLAIENAMKLYISSMEASGCTGLVCTDPEKMETNHMLAFDFVTKHFSRKRMLGKAVEISETYHEKLEGLIYAKYYEYCDQNAERLRALGVAVGSLISFALCYFTLSFFELIGYKGLLWVRLGMLVALVFWLKDTIIEKIAKTVENEDT